MGSGSTKVQVETGTPKLENGYSKNALRHQFQKTAALLMSEYRSKATQTDERDCICENTKRVSNGTVLYDIETVERQTSVDIYNAQDRMSNGENKREQSDMGTNTILTSITDKPGENKNIFEDAPDEENTTYHDSKTMKPKSSDVIGKSFGGSLGEISLERYGKYRVRTESDTEKCTISAVTFLDTGDLVLIDRSNQKIKYVDAEFKFISAQDLSAKPWSVCARGVDVYVTIGSTHIQHLCINDMFIEPVEKLEVNGRCLGICMFREYIAVGLQVGEVHLLDSAGVRHGTIRLPVLDDKPCNPWHMCVTQEENLLITDSEAAAVFCINKDSQIMFTYKEMSSPRATTVDSYGNILVVGRDKDSGVVVKILSRDWELHSMLHIEQPADKGSKGLLTWKALEFVPYCVDVRTDNVVVMGGIRESLKIMKLTTPTT